MMKQESSEEPRRAGRRATWMSVVLAAVALIGCRPDLAAPDEEEASGVSTASTALQPGPTATPTAEPAPPTASSSAAPPPEEVLIEEYAAEGAFVLRGSRAKGYAVLFGGQCAQPQGYADAIKLAAARRTQLVALRGDRPCSGEFRGWKFDLDALSQRIDRTFRGLGLGEPRDVLLIGYSQGASVAELLAAREPEKFTRVVLIAKPSRPDPWHFKKARAVVTMAGTLDAQQAMIQGGRALAAAGVRARYFPLPGAAHGYMGDDPEGTFEDVFAWLYEEPPG